MAAQGIVRNSLERMQWPIWSFKRVATLEPADENKRLP